MTSKRTATPRPEPDLAEEREALLETLREHDRVTEGKDRPANMLAPGVTHLIVPQKDGTKKLVEKRKSFF